MNIQPVYCKHKWTPHGPNTSRCEICREFWRNTDKTEEPAIIIGYTLPNNQENNSISK